MLRNRNKNIPPAVSGNFMKTLTNILIMLFFGQLATGQEHQKERDIPSSQLLSNSDYHQRKELANK